MTPINVPEPTNQPTTVEHQSYPYFYRHPQPLLPYTIYSLPEIDIKTLVKIDVWTEGTMPPDGEPWRAACSRPWSRRNGQGQRYVGAAFDLSPNPMAVPFSDSRKLPWCNRQLVLIGPPCRDLKIASKHVIHEQKLIIHTLPFFTDYIHQNPTTKRNTWNVPRPVHAEKVSSITNNSALRQSLSSRLHKKANAYSTSTQPQRQRL